MARVTSAKTIKRSFSLAENTFLGNFAKFLTKTDFPLSLVSFQHARATFTNFTFDLCIKRPFVCKTHANFAITKHFLKSFEGFYNSIQIERNSFSRPDLWQLKTRKTSRHSTEVQNKTFWTHNPFSLTFNPCLTRDSYLIFMEEICKIKTRSFFQEVSSTFFRW